MSLLVIALGQPSTPPATDAEAFVAATSAEQVAGTWHTGTAYLRFDEDGTFREAVGEGALDSSPYAINAYRFEGAVMLVTEVEVSGVPSCRDAVGRYELRLREGGNLEVAALEDPCRARGDNLARVYASSESETHVVATSAEQILGTWHEVSACICFDEDGTFRSARSVNKLAYAPYATSTFRFEEAVMLVSEVAVSGVPSCGDAIGRYRVWLLEGGSLQVVPIDDPCPGRADDMTRVYERVE